MRLPEAIIQQSIDDQCDRGVTASRLNVDEITQALRDEGWHFVSTPKYVVAEPTQSYFWGGVEMRLSTVIDDTIVEETRAISPECLHDSVGDVRGLCRRDLALAVSRKVGQLLGFDL